MGTIREQYREELRKGTGRAILLMQNNPTEDFASELFYACVHELDYDPQCSDGRGDYLYEMARMLPEPAAFEARLLEALWAPEQEDWSLGQLFDLAVLAARAGNKRAREVIYQKYEALCVEEDDPTGAVQIIDLDGLAGLAVVAGHAGKVLLKDPATWEGQFVWYVMNDSEIPQDTMAFLEKQAEGNKYIKAYYEDVRKYQLSEKRREDKRPIPTYQDITRGILSAEKCKYFPRIRQTPREDLMQLAADFQKETDDVRLIKYLRLFGHVKYPLEHTDILKVVYGKDGEVRSWAIRALRHFSNADIRRLIDFNFQTRQNLWETFELLEEGYQPSDLRLMEKVLSEEKDGFSFHAMGMSLKGIFKKFNDPGLVDLMVILYQKGHCACCRHSLIESLISQNILPEWIADEAIYDCSMDIRELVRDYLAGKCL